MVRYTRFANLILNGAGMYADIFATIAPIFLCAVLGYGWSRSGVPFENEFVSRIAVNIGAPCLLISSLNKVETSLPALLEVVSAAVLILISTLFLAVIICKVFKLPFHVYLGPMSFPNTVNMGLPISFFAFGEPGLVVALSIYLLVALTQSTLGVALASGRSPWRNTLRSPIVYSALLAVAMVITDTHLPRWADNSVTLLGSMCIPLLLITLGVSLSQLKVKDFTLSCALGLVRLFIGFVIGVAVAELLSLEGAVRGVVIIQSSMPAALLNYLIALRYHDSADAVAGLVVMSTLFSFITLPLLLWFVL